jgi:hypothetical protein
MRRTPVASSSIASFGYDAEKREIEIEFRPSGDVYRYFDVPPKENSTFIAAESKGRYFNLVFRPKNYRYELVKRGRKLA